MSDNPLNGKGARAGMHLSLSPNPRGGRAKRHVVLEVDFAGHRLREGRTARSADAPVSCSCGWRGRVGDFGQRVAGNHHPEGVGEMDTARAMSTVTKRRGASITSPRFTQEED